LEVTEVLEVLVVAEDLVTVPETDKQTKIILETMTLLHPEATIMKTMMMMRRRMLDL
jgi:hypothetical protein